MDKTSKFIITCNQNSATELVNLGLHLVSTDGNQWVFLNTKQLVFSEIDSLIYTNKLFI